GTGGRIRIQNNRPRRTVPGAADLRKKNEPQRAQRTQSEDPLRNPEKAPEADTPSADGSRITRCAFPLCPLCPRWLPSGRFEPPDKTPAPPAHKPEAPARDVPSLALRACVIAPHE